MFPEMNPDLEQQILNINANTRAIPKTLGRSFKFDFCTGQFALSNGKLVDSSKEETVKQWISLCLRTFKDKYLVYKDTGFGTNLQNVLGHKLDTFYKTLVCTEIKKGLAKNSQIKSVDNIQLTTEKDKLNISAQVKLVDGSIIDVEEAV